MTINSRGSSPSKSPCSQPITFEVLSQLLKNRGWDETAKCLQEEVGRSLCIKSNREENDVDLVTPGMEEELHSYSNSATQAASEEKQRLVAVVEEAVKQGEKMSEVRDLVTRMREIAAMSQIPSVAELELLMQKKEAQIRELEIIRSEHDALIQTLRLEVEQFERETSDIRALLENREDDETKARVTLTKIDSELRRLAAEVNSVPVMSTQARKIQALLVDWHDHGSHLQMQVQSLFNDIDLNRDGRLEWNNSEIRTFVHEIFKRNNILWPDWQEPVFYDMYRRCDVNHSYSLEYKEAANFARSCFESALALVLTGQSDNGHDLIAEYQHASAQSVPVVKSAMTYSSGVIINFVDFATVFAPVIAANQAHRSRMMRIIDTGEHLKATMRTYRECDKDGNGRLTWNNGEIRDFITACFLAHGLSPPHEDQMYHMYSQFDADKNHYLDMRECLEMVDALFRSTFVEAQAPVAQVRRDAISRTREVREVRTASPGSITRQLVRSASDTAVKTLRSSSPPVVGYPLQENSSPGKVVRSASGNLQTVSPRQIPARVLNQSPNSSRPASPVGTATFAVSYPPTPVEMVNATGRISPGRISPGRISPLVGVGAGTSVMPPAAPLPGTTMVVPSAQTRTTSPTPSYVSQDGVRGMTIPRNPSQSMLATSTSVTSFPVQPVPGGNPQPASGILRPPATRAGAPILGSNRTLGQASSYKQLVPVLSRSRR